MSGLTPKSELSVEEPYFVVEAWALSNASAQFVPQATEEARDYVQQRNFKSKGGFYVHGPIAYRRKTSSESHHALGSPK